MSLGITRMTNGPKEWHACARMPHVGVPVRAPAYDGKNTLSFAAPEKRPPCQICGGPAA